MFLTGKERAHEEGKEGERKTKPKPEKVKGMRGVHTDGSPKQGPGRL